MKVVSIDFFLLTGRDIVHQAFCFHAAITVTLFDIPQKKERMKRKETKQEMSIVSDYVILFLSFSSFFSLDSFSLIGLTTIQAALDDATESWGIKVERVEM